VEDVPAELTGQRLVSEHVVLYNAPGTNVSAVAVRRSDFPLPIITEHKVYWGTAKDADEADYLVAVLNSSVANEAIKPFQSMGLMGERDIEKKLLDLPIPQFKAKDSRHEALVCIGKTAREKACRLLQASSDVPTSLARQRAWIREQLTNELDAIGHIVATLL
jgi:hypothetical protein